MTEAEQPPFMKVVLWAAILLGSMIVVLILHFISWNIGISVYGWSTSSFGRDTALLIGWGIVVPAIIIVLAIVGTKIYEQTKIITLLFGIAFAALGTLIAIVSGVQIAVQTGDLIIKAVTEPLVAPFYVVFVIMSAIGVVFGLLIGFKGKAVINYYYEKLAS